MSQSAFHQKWEKIRTDASESNAEEPSIYVEKDDVPRTQRQLSLYNYFRFIQTHLERTGAKNLLEIGCGRGTIGLYCKTYMNLDVALMDNEENAIKIAKESFDKRNLDATFMVGDAFHMDIPDNSFDAVVSIGLAEHVDNVTELFAEQFRILRPGGVMISLNIPKKFSVQELNILMRSVKKLFGLYKDPVGKDYYRNSFSAKEYARFAREAGFDKTEITHTCPFPVYVPIRRSTDRLITTVRRGILRVRSLFMRYPYKTNGLIAHSHFLVAQKPHHG